MPQRTTIILAAGLSLASCASPKVVTSTPAGIEIDCTAGLSCSSAQAVADMAQAHCRKFGQNAQQDHFGESGSGRRWATYKCVSAGPSTPR